MDTNVNINNLKRQLNVELDYTSDDIILQHFIDVAEVAIQNYLGVNSLTGYTSTTIPITIEQGVLLIASHYYINRNIVSFAQGFTIPLTLTFLIDYYKDWTVQ